MIYLDTHVVVWLYAGLIDKLSDTAKLLLNENDITISPIIRLELQYLYEIKRIREGSTAIVSDLSDRIGLKVCAKDFQVVMAEALKHNWTRDPFDRIITATAALENTILVTKDRNMIQNYNQARW